MSEKVRFPDFRNAQVGDKVTHLEDGEVVHGIVTGMDDENDSFPLLVAFWKTVQNFSLNGFHEDERQDEEDLPSLYHGHLSISDFQPSIDSAYRREGR